MNECVQRTDVISASFLLALFKVIFLQKQRRCCWLKEQPNAGLCAIIKENHGGGRASKSSRSGDVFTITGGGCRINRHRFSVPHLCCRADASVNLHAPRESLFNPVEVVE